MLLDATQDLPETVTRIITDVVNTAARVLGDTLHSIVLFGSAAENRLRATSDVNLLIVLVRFEPARIDGLRETLQGAHAAIRLAVMWLTEEEIHAAGEAFAVKFADIARRHRVLFGPDPYAGFTISRSAAIVRVRQVLLNLVLRLRAAYALERDRIERIAIVIADAAGPLRAGAAEMLELRGTPAPSARDALEQLASQWSPTKAPELLQAMRTARETRQLDVDLAPAVLLDLIELAAHLHRDAQTLS